MDGFPILLRPDFNTDYNKYVRTSFLNLSNAGMPLLVPVEFSLVDRSTEKRRTGEKKYGENY